MWFYRFQPIYINVNHPVNSTPQYTSYSLLTHCLYFCKILKIKIIELIGVIHYSKYSGSTDTAFSRPIIRHQGELKLLSVTDIHSQLNLN